ICVVRASAPALMTCRALGGGLQGSGFHTTQLLGAEDGAATPLVLVGSVFEAESGVFEAISGDRVPVPPDTYDATQLASGVVTLSILDKRVLLGAASAPEPLAGTDPVEHGHDPSAPQLASDALVWLARGRLFARDVGASTATDLGATAIDSIPIDVSGCRTADLLALDLDAAGFLLRSGGGWSIARPEPPLERPLEGSLSYACDDQGVSAIAVAHDARTPGAPTTLTEARCTPEGCRREQVELSDLGHLAGSPVAVRLGDRILLAFHRTTPEGADAGVRMRLAPLRELGGAPETVLFDPLELEPTRDTATHVRLALHARGDAAWVLVFHEGAWIPIAVAPDGAFEAVRAAAATP
ncbi:MAG: hypothetical protein M3Y87_21100, partial [Myxococcota bacterium]|nr:hypothetical protein [Myxococcota bacterium]